MQRDVLLLTEMIDAAEQAQALANGVSAEDLAADRQRRDALLWNSTVLGEAAGQLTDEVKKQFPMINWQQPARLRTGSSSATGLLTWTSSTPPPPSSCQSSPPRCERPSTRWASRPDRRTRGFPDPSWIFCRPAFLSERPS
jgi:type II secretory pathway pseudopilin PulG